MLWEVMFLGICNCTCKQDRAFFAVTVSAILGILAVFLLISGVITVPVRFLQAAFSLFLTSAPCPVRKTAGKAE